MNTTLEVRAHMTRYPLTATRGMHVGRALELMRENSIRHLPVLDGERIVGVVSERDLGGAKNLLKDAQSENLRVGQFMSIDPYVARLDSRLSEVTEAMCREKWGCAVILNGRNEVAGIFTTTDALHVLSKMLREREAAVESSSEGEGEYIRYMEEWLEWDSSMGE